MGLSKLLELGVDAAIAAGGNDLARHLADRGLSPELAGGAQEALRLLPKLLSSFEAKLYDEASPMAQRALFPLVTSYAWRRDDLVPAVDGSLILGFLDDTYLAMRIAQKAAMSSEEKLEEHLHVLSRVLPAEVVKALDAQVDEALTSAVALAEQRGG